MYNRKWHQYLMKIFSYEELPESDKNREAVKGMLLSPKQILQLKQIITAKVAATAETRPET